MKKATMFALALLTAPMAVEAQSASGTVNASATILAYLDVQNVSDLDFGSIAAGSGATLTPGTVPATGSLGVLQIDHNSEVIVTATVPTFLTLSGAPNLPVTFSCGYAATPSGTLSGSAAACNALPNRAGNGDGTTRTSYIQVGGDISSANTTNRIPGTYTGSLVFTVTANY
jgi:spore coat protein U-like protein